MRPDAPRSDSARPVKRRFKKKKKIIIIIKVIGVYIFMPLTHFSDVFYTDLHVELDVNV